MSDPMNGAELLNAIDDFLARYIAFPNDESRAAVAAWIVHCHAVESFESTPRLAFISPEKGSGKTRGLEVLALLVPSPIHAVNMSPAALYRLVADRQPTLLLDECDTYLGSAVAKQHEELRGLINAGHRRGATVYRGEVAGKTVKVVEFPAYAACALAGIGDLPETILDRSIIVAMKRRAPDEHVESFRERIVRPSAELLYSQIEEWAAEHAGTLGRAFPVMPDGIIDRAADVWEPLIAVADQAGGDWPDLVRHAAVTLCKARADRDPSLGILLLTDCQRLFDEHAVDRLKTETLVDALLEVDESPWGDLKGKPLDARGLAWRLRKYGVRPADHRFDDAVRKGYRREDFHDAWTRYLPPVADVAHVAHPQGKTGAEDDQAVALFEDSQGYDLHNNNNNITNGAVSAPPPPFAEEGQQAQHDLEPTPDHDEDPADAPSADDLEQILHDPTANGHVPIDDNEVERIAYLAREYETEREP